MRIAPFARSGILLFALLACSHPDRVLAQTSSLNTVFAIVGARIEIGDGKVIDKGTVLLRDGIIEAVGTDVKVPPEAEIIKGDGLTVYPGFIDAHSTRGVTPPDAVPVQDVAPDATAGPQIAMREANRRGIRPELRASDYLALTDELLRPARASGFTTELITPTGGLMAGVGALVNLNGLPKRDCVVRSEVAVNFSFSNRGGGGAATPVAGADFGARGYPGSLMGIMAFTRQTLLDAQLYGLQESAFAKGSSQRPPADETLRALQPVLAGKLPVIYDADTENEIRRAVKMADEFHLKLILSGGTEAYKVAPMLAKSKTPVLLSLNFGQEPGVAAPAGGAGGAGFGGRPGGLGNRPGGGGGGGRRNGVPGGTTPGTPVAPSTTPVDPTLSVPDNQPPVGFPGRTNQVPGGLAPNTSIDNAEDENSTIPKAVIAERHKIWEEKVATAATLDKAGVPFAFTTKGVQSQTVFLTNLRRAIRAGLSRDVALRALTLDAARLLGVDKQLGTIAVGKTAAIVVMSGDFVAPTTRVRYLFIDKNRFEPDRDTGPLPTLPRRPFGTEDEHE